MSLAFAAGRGHDIDYGYPSVADVSTTTFRVLTTHGLLSTHVYALGFDDGLDPTIREARQQLIDLREALTDIDSTLGPDLAGPASSNDPMDVAVISAPVTDGSPVDVRAWPGPALPRQPLSLSPRIGDDNLSVLLGRDRDRRRRCARRGRGRDRADRVAMGWAAIPHLVPATTSRRVRLRRGVTSAGAYSRAGD